MNWLKSAIPRLARQPNLRIPMITSLWFITAEEPGATEQPGDGSREPTPNSRGETDTKTAGLVRLGSKGSSTLLPHKLYLVNLFQIFQNPKAGSTKSSEFYATFIFKVLCASHSTLGPIYFIGKIKTQQYLADIIQRSFF